MTPFALLAEATSHAGEHGGADKAPFPAFDTTWYASQLFWLAILFTVMYLALSRFVLPKLSDTLEKRSDRIASDLDQATRLHDQAVEAQQALELRIAQARNKARETSEKAHQKMEAEMAAETARVDAEISKKLEAADARIDTLRATAMKNVEQIAIDTTAAMTARFGLKSSAADLKSAVSAAMGKK